MAAFEEIYRTFSSTVYTIALRITQNAQDAEEAAQDVFVKVHRSLKGFKFDSSFGTWLYRITVNSAINIYRRGLARTKMSVPYDGDKEPPARKEYAGSGVGAAEAAEIVNKILKKLSPEHRACIVLREIEGLDYKEMAATLGIPINTVRSRLKRAREAIIAHSRKGGVSYAL